MWRGYIQGAAMVAVVCALVLCLGEAGARVLELSPKPLITLDSCTGYKGIPGASHDMPGPEGKVTVSINSEGFRDIEHLQKKADGAYRVLLLGDSFTEALQVPLEDTFWRKLQKKADDAKLSLEVIAMGVSSFGTGQEVLAYECYGRKYDPDAVVLVFVHGRDVMDDSFRSDQFTPRFSLEASVLTLDESYKERIRERLEKRMTLYPGTFYRLRDSSEFTRYLYTKIANARAGAKLEASSKDGKDPVYMEEYAHVYEEPWRSVWPLTGALVERLAADTSADKARLIILEAPTPQEFEPWLIQEPSRFDMEKPHRELAAIAHKAGAELIPLLPALKEAAQARPVHFPNDPHLTRYGHEITTQVLFAALRSSIPAR